MVQDACRKREIVPLACNAMPDHVHLFVRLPPSIAPSSFVGEIKGASAYAFNRRHGERLYLKWQDGYGVVSVRSEEQNKVIVYVENQQQLHAERRTSRLLESTEQAER